MPKPDLKGIPVSPLTGALDARSSPDAMSPGSLRMRQNLRTVAQNKLRRGNGFTKLLDSEDYNNADFHDQLKTFHSNIRQPVTTIFMAESSRRARSLIVATQRTVAVLNEHSANYRILGYGYGGEAVATGDARRFKVAQVGDYVAFTNDYDKPFYYILGQNGVDGDPTLKEFADFELIGLSRAKVCWSWRNCLFFADVEMDTERFGSRLLWSDYNNPTGFDPANTASISGFKDLYQHERILAGAPANNSFLIYTTHGVWEMVVVGGEQQFSFRRVYNGEDNPSTAVLKYPNTLICLPDAHAYMAEDGIYFYSQYYGKPERVEWLHRATSLLYDTIDVSNCEAHVSAVNNNEAFFSVARIGAENKCPDITLRINLTYKVADIIDHGFTAFCNYKSYDSATVRDFIIENRICTLSELTSKGYGFSYEGLPDPVPEATAIFAPNEVFTDSYEPLYVYELNAAKMPVLVSRTSGVATMDSVLHGFSTNDVVDISGMSDPSFNSGTKQITVLTANRFTYPSPGPDVSATVAVSPYARKLGSQIEGVAIVQVDGTVIVQSNNHGLVTGNSIRITGKKPGNPKLNKDEVVVTVDNSDKFHYTATVVQADTSIGAANISDILQVGVLYEVQSPSTDPSEYAVTNLTSGRIYRFIPGSNDDELVLTSGTLTTDSYFTYNGDGATLNGPVGDIAKKVTASIASGLAVSFRKLEAKQTPTLVQRDDEDDILLTTITLASHGYVAGDHLEIGRIPFQSFNMREVELSAVTTDTFSYSSSGEVLAATNPANPANAKIRKLASAYVNVEDTTASASDDSLCALLAGQRLDDICRACEGAVIFVACSSEDWCLKEFESDTFYREICSNPTEQGSTGDNGYSSSVGSYVEDGFDSLMRFAPMFDALTEDSVLVEQLKVNYVAAYQSEPSELELRVGISSQPADSNTDECRLVWHTLESKELKCLSASTAAQHLENNTQPVDTLDWKYWYHGRFLHHELKLSGVGGDAIFSGVVGQAKKVENRNF